MSDSASVQERVLRVSQLDATEVDEELSDILQYQLLEILQPLPPNLSILKLRPELKALVRLLIWWYSVAKTGATFGQSMLDLVYNTGDSNSLGLRQKLSLFVFSVLADWVAERSEDIAPSFFPSHSRKALKLIKVFSTILRALSLVNFVTFLLYGRYPSLKERFSGLTMIPSRPQTLRELNYDYMNREILWHGFSEFIFFVLPQLNLFALKNWARRSFGRWGGKIKRNVDFSKCSFCEETLNMPHVTNCGHVYCYYCISANCLADSKFPCSVCGCVIDQYTAAHLQTAGF